MIFILSTISRKDFHSSYIIDSSNAQLSNKGSFMCDKITYRDQHKQYFIGVHSAKFYLYRFRLLFDLLWCRYLPHLMCIGFDFLDIFAAIST